MPIPYSQNTKKEVIGQFRIADDLKNFIWTFCDRPTFSLSEITAFRELFLECPHNKLLLDDFLYQLTGD